MTITNLSFPSGARDRARAARIAIGPPLTASRYRGELREDADTMSWSTFTATYAPSAGPLRLGHWECIDTERPATRWGPQAQTFRATLALGDRIETATASATGPVAALTAMLYEHGVAV